MMEAAASYASDHRKHQSRMGAVTYKDTLTAIRRNVHEDHYKLERLDKLKQNVNKNQEANKKTNAIQKLSGVTRTVVTQGLIAYSSINKNKGHEPALKEELLFREVPFNDGAGFMALKKSLMVHEEERATTEEERSISKKAFMRLSNAIFVGVDIDSVDIAGNQFTLAEDVDTAVHSATD